MTHSLAKLTFRKSLKRLSRNETVSGKSVAVVDPGFQPGLRGQKPDALLLVLPPRPLRQPLKISRISEPTNLSRVVQAEVAEAHVCKR